MHDVITLSDTTSIDKLNLMGSFNGILMVLYEVMYILTFFVNSSDEKYYI